MSKPFPVKPQLESTHSASFCNKNHQNLFINKKVLKNTILSAQNLGITPLTANQERNGWPVAGPVEGPAGVELPTAPLVTFELGER